MMDELAILMEDGSAFKSRSDAQDAVDALNAGNPDRPFRVKSIGDGMWQISCKVSSLDEETIAGMDVFDRMFIMPGDGPGSARVWMGTERYDVRREGRRYVAEILGADGKKRKVKVPKQFYGKVARKAIDDAAVSRLDEGLRRMLTIGALGASAMLGTGYVDNQPYEVGQGAENIRRQYEMTQGRTDGDRKGKISIREPKRYAELLVKGHGDPLLLALAKCESGFDPSVVGDHHMRDRAYGILQIRKPVLIDVNERFGTRYSERDMVPADPNDKEEIEKAVRNSIDVYGKYLRRYGMTEAPEEARAKLWNVGPLSKRMASDPVARRANRSIADKGDRYWKKVRELL